MRPATTEDPPVRQHLLGPVVIGPVASGGHCVARHDGRVIFVRHGLPGETVMLQVTDTSHASFWRADAVEVLQASPDRVRPACPVAGPGMCGGCDFQHVELSAQRRLKAAVVAEQLQRLAGISWDGEVEAVDAPATRDGLHWRTRMRYHVDPDGRAGLRKHRSREIVALPADGCLIASPKTPGVVARTWPVGAEVLTAYAANGEAVLVDGRLQTGAAELVEHAAERDWRVAADGFWQVHPRAAQSLVDAVLEGLHPQPGEAAFDLFCGVGLFAGALADRGCEVWGIESSRVAVSSAQRNLADVGSQVHLSTGRVDGRLRQLPQRADLVVLDPPRAGAGKQVMQAVIARRPRAIAYVACDPVSLARDLGTAQRSGYAVSSVRAFDLFPMTQHVECVAMLAPATTG